MIEKLLALAPKSTNRQLHFFVPFNFGVYSFLYMLQTLMKIQNTFTCITGRNPKIAELIPIVDYVKIFNGMGTLHRSVEKNLISAYKLKEQFDAIHEICIDNLTQLNDDILIEQLEPIPFKHPVANNKYEALSWCFKHEMWHSAEMEAIKVALNYPIVWLEK